MKILKLYLDELAVESFPTLPQHDGRGTVHAANVPTTYPEVEYSCGNSCENNCWPVHETEGCGGGGIWSAGYTDCGNCQRSVNEVGSCLPAQSCGYYTPCM